MASHSNALLIILGFQGLHTGFHKTLATFLQQSSTSFLKSNAFFFAETIFISFNQNTLDARHVVSMFPALGKSSMHRAVLQQPVPSPSYFPTSHDPPCAAETRGKVAALRRLDTW